jgi:hypothetical protein
MSFEDPRDLDDELGRPPLQDTGYFGRFLWWRRYPGEARPGEATDFGWTAVLVSLGFLAAFGVIGAVVLWLFR